MRSIVFPELCQCSQHNGFVEVTWVPKQSHFQAGISRLQGQDMSVSWALVNSDLSWELLNSKFLGLFLCCGGVFLVLCSINFFPAKGCNFLPPWVLWEGLGGIGAFLQSLQKAAVGKLQLWVPQAAARCVCAWCIWHYLRAGSMCKCHGLLHTKGWFWGREVWGEQRAFCEDASSG